MNKLTLEYQEALDVLKQNMPNDLKNKQLYINRLQDLIYSSLCKIDTIDNYQIYAWKLLKIVHYYTDIISIRIVDDKWCEHRHKHIPTYLTCDMNYEKDRILKYYANAPLWNLTTGLKEELSETHNGSTARKIQTCIEAKCHFSDIEEMWNEEQSDIKKAKQKAYNEQRKKHKNNE